MSIVGTISAENGILTSTLTDSDILNPTRTGSYSDDYLLEDLTIGQIITIELTSTEIDTYLQLIDADTGEVITEDDDSSTGANSRFRFTALEGVNYIVRVSSYNSRAIGTYQLIAQSDAPPQIAGTISAANGIVAGSLTTEDSFHPTKYQNYFIDDYQLTDVTAGEVVTLNLNSADFSTYIQLINADTGEEIKEDYNSGQGNSSELKFVAVTGVNYLVRVSSSSEETIGTYQLNANSAATDLADLTITDVTAPATITLGESVEVSWTVANLGNADTTPNSWYEQVYLSRDTTFNPNKDASLGYVYNSGSIAVGETQSFSSNINVSSFDLNIANEASSNNPLEGDWYLLFVADSSDDQLESNEANNIAVHQIQLNATDLAITNVEAPASVSVNDSTSVSWTVENIGDVSAFGYWSNNVFLSDDEFLSGDDIVVGYGERENLEQFLQLEFPQQQFPLGQQSQSEPLFGGESYNVSSEIAIGNIEPGSRYLLFTVNTSGDLIETDLTNNVIAVPIEISGADANLSINATAPTTAALGESVAVSWTVNNTGSQSAKAYWQDIIYLSDDEYFDSTDTYVSGQYTEENTPLGSQSNYTVNRNITIPNSAQVGSRYLLFVADRYNNQYETNETDNVYAAPIEILAPDLTIEATAPDKSNANTRISGSWTVKNTGSIETSVSYWYDYVYFSTDETYDSSDTLLSTYYINGSTSPLAVGDTYTKNYNLTVPDVEAGNYYLLFHTDRDNRQGETDETNNISAVPIEITQSPNLTITDVNVPNKGYIGNSINASWTVNNSGEGTAFREYWYDYIYLSTDENYDSGDTLLTYNYTGSSTPLAAEDSYTANSNIVIPDVEAGDYYLLFYADGNRVQGESNETDNITAVPIDLFQSDIDLAVDNITAPSDVKPGQRISGSWTVRNNGSTPIDGKYWYDYVYFSVDEKFDASDIYVTSNYFDNSINPLEAGGSYSKNFNLYVPNVKVGDYHLIFTIDKDNYLKETDETNNIASVPIKLTLPNLKVTATNAPNTAIVNDTAEVSWTVTNEGNRNTSSYYLYDSVYLSEDENYDAKDIQLKSLEKTNPNLEPGGSYTSSSQISLPNTKAGNYYLIFYTNKSDYYYSEQESDITDNFTAVPISLSVPDVDLSIAVNSSPTEALVQGGVNLSWTVTNNGTDAAKARWYDYIYVSDDPVYDSGDRYVDSFYNSDTTPLAAGQSYTKNKSVTIPNTKSGERYLLFVADAYNNLQGESNDTNNTVAVPIDIKAPNLTISDVIAPLKANKSSNDVAVSWKVTNTGNETTLADYWYDTVYFSKDATYDSSDLKLSDVRADYSYINYYYHSRFGAGQSYSRTSNINIPNADPGNYYLLFITDNYNHQGETNGADNTLVIPFEVLNTTNIQTTSATAPLQATLNDTIDVSWTVTNTGSATASATWYDYIYLSQDDKFDSNDVFVSNQKQANNTFIDPGESYTVSKAITIPKAAGTGDSYLLFVADGNKKFTETNETDNIYAAPIELNATNLQVTNATVPGSASFNENLNLSWTVSNTGAGRASANWYDYIYLSNDAVYDSSDTYLNQLNTDDYTPLNAGDAYTVSQSVIIPRTVNSGNQYILFVTDRNNSQGETDETDNILAVPIEVKSPDLEFAEVIVPANASLNQTFNLSWTVTNTGEGTAFPDYYSNWRDYVYLSDDAIYDETDRPLTNRAIINSLESGNSYTFNADVRLSDDRVGSHYILFVSDVQNVEKESNETNNVYAAPIDIQAANLEISEVSSPAQVFLNQPISLSWTVTNTGTGGAFAPKNTYYSYYDNPWTDLVYLSKDEVIDENDRILVDYNDRIYNLASEDSYTISRNVYIPSTAAGDYYLLFATDAGKVLVESDETDNVYAKPITIGATNLEVTAVNAPTDLILNQTISASWTVSNTGNVTAPTDWYDYVYISDDRYLDDSDVFLSYQWTYDRTPLAGGDSYTVNKDLVIPHTATGDRYLLFVADRNNAQGETNENDNIYALPVSINAPNLTVTDTNAPQSSYLGETVEISWTVTNQGAVSAPKSGYDYVYISDDQYLDDSDVNLIAQTTGDYTSLSPNDSYTISRDVIIPRTSIGERYLLFVADRNNRQGETDETDNLVAVPIELTALDVDLVVSDISAPIESYAGEEVEVAWTVTNNGSDDATGTWTDRIYLASDAENIQPNEIYGSFNFTGTVAAGESIERRQKITLPQTLKGNFKLVVKTDIDDRLIEYGREGNNTTVREELFTSILPTFPNLQVTNVTAPITAFSSQKTVVQWTVSNTGNGATSAPRWLDSVWLSFDRNFDGADILLGQVANTSYLNAGDSYNNSIDVTLPQGIDGNYYFLVQTDWGRNQVFEFQNENDNLGVSNVSDIELTPPPDLQVSVNAPSNAFSGQYTSLSWTVTNEGQGRTLQSSWYDEVYLSTDTVLDGSDKYLGRQNHSGILQPGESYIVTNTTSVFKLPEGISGDYYFIVRTDAGGQVYESALSANNTGFDGTPTTVFLTPPPDLEISLDAPNTAQASHNLTIDYSVSNYGATATTNGKWIDTFYLSVDDQLDASDLVLGSRTNYGSLDIGELRDNSINLTLPDGISGNYYLFAKTDSNDDVFELDNDNNIAFETITIDSKPADLAVSEVIIPSIIEAGTGTQISWTVTNQGTGDTVKTSWNDQLWLSLDSVVGNSDDRLLKTFTHNGLLNAGSSYTNNELVTIPFNLQGNYQLYIKTDVNNSVYEADREANNTSVFSPIAVTRETPDLQVTTVNAPVAGQSGESITVNWSVANSGTGKTNSNYWYDEVFLSTDRDSGDSSDISLGKVYHSGSLERDETYDVSHTFNLPQNINGDYYVVVRTDTNYYTGNYSGDRVLEAFENNNELATSSKTSISLNAVPDLVIEQIDAPLQAISGQTFDVSWTVSNQGTDANNSWRDVFYLSRDQVFDRSSDIYLGSSFHYGNLAAGAEYNKTATFNIPRGLSGSFYVFGVTDSGNDVYERDGENNNIAFDGNSLNVILPPPADLGTGSINIASDTATSGDFISLNYTVQSLGANLPLGTWTDSIYLSADEQWDINDLLLTKITASQSSIIDGSYTRNVYTQLPGVVPGDYHLIVRSDILNEIPESNEDNNITVSAETINVDIPSLEIDTSVSGTLAQGQEAYYRVNVPSGETLQFVLDSLSNNAVNELYVSYGKMPTRADFDFGFEDIAADQDLVVPLSEAGTYYILARGQYVPGVTQDYSLSVNTIDFGITDIETTVGDKSGTITFAIEGAKFNRNLIAALENDAGEIIKSSSIWYEDSTKIFATFDLSNATIGDYNLKVSQPSINADFVENEVGEIIPILRETTLESVIEDGFKVVAAREDDLQVTVTSTSRVGAGQYFDIVLSYANNGTHDLEAPLLHLEANQNIGFINIQDGDEFVGNKSMTLLGISNEGAAGILRPGEIGTIRLRGRAGGEGTINISASQVEDDGIPLDYEKFINYLGGDLADPAWSNAENALKEQFGTSWSSFASGLASLATENSALGEYSHSVSELWTDVALDAWGDAVLNLNSNVSTENNFSNLNSAEFVTFSKNNFTGIKVNNQSLLTINETESNFLEIDPVVLNQIADDNITNIEYLLPDYFPQTKLTDTLKDIADVFGLNVVNMFYKESGSNDVYLEGELYEGEIDNVPASLLIIVGNINLPSFADIIDDLVEINSDNDINTFAKLVADNVEVNVRSIEGILALLKPYSAEIGTFDPFDILMERVEDEIRKVADEFEEGDIFPIKRPSAPVAAEFLRHFVGEFGQSTVIPSLDNYQSILSNLRNNLSTTPPQWIIDRLSRTDGIHEDLFTEIKGFTPQYPYDALADHVHLDINDEGTNYYSTQNINLNFEKVKSFIEEIQESDEYKRVEEFTDGQIKSAVQKGFFVLENNPRFDISEDGQYNFEPEDAPIIQVPTLNYGPGGGNKFQLFSDLQKDIIPDVDPFLTIGNTDGPGFAVINEIYIETNCGKRNFSADVDFWWFDGYTWDLRDRSQATGLIGLGTPLVTGLPSSVFEYNWLTQQYGYSEPFTVSLEVDDTVTGSITVPKKHDEDCDDDTPVPPTSSPLGNTTTGVFVSHDPNDILGPEGFGEEQWIDAEKPLDYTIRFENDPKLASAPAQVVRITQQLDSDLDFRTFRVGDFGFGDTFIDVPDNRAFYQTRLDLVAEKGIYVDVFAGIDIATGEAFWEFRSIDPATGEQPSDPLLGFLPPNLTKPEGDGFVSYSIRTDRDIETGAVIDAEATIVFDINEPIDTPAIKNTIDVGKPISTVNALPSVSDSSEFTVSWSGNDDANGSAIADYTIYVAQNGGEFIPWLENTALTEASFTGTLGSSYEFYAVARDNAGNIQDIPTSAQASTAIAGGNNPPVLLSPIGTQIVAEDSNFNLTISSEIFIDTDEGEVLTYTATLADGSELPSWLTFDTETKTFSGTPTNEDLGNLNIIVTVTDKLGETVSDTFELIVENVNDAPTLNNALASQTATEDEEFSFTFPVDTFSDVDAGDSLIYSATNADGSELPDWLTFDTETRTFGGTPVNENIGILSVRVTATDNDSESVSDTFELEVVNVNDTPTVKTALANQIATEDEAFSFTLAEDTFNDVDAGDKLTYTATLSNGSELPNWLSFNADTRTFSGIPVNEDVGNLSIIVTATDQSGETISNTFELTVENVNDAPILETAIANQTAIEDSGFSFTFPENTFKDVDIRDVLTYTANLADGSELPSWLSFNAETRTFNGTPVNENVGTLSIKITATDNDGESVSNTFDLEAININDTPTIENALVNQIATEDEAFSFTLAENTFNDVDAGDSLTYSANLADGDELPSWLTFNADTRTFSGTPVNDNVGTLSVLVTATDNDGESASSTFELEVANVNNAPTIESTIANQTATEDKAFSFTFNENTFDDVDTGDSLTYTANLADGSELPSWLTFDAETRTFSGTPVNKYVGTISLLVTATDNDGEFVSNTFELEVINVNDAPTLNTVIANQVATEDEVFNFTLTENILNDVDAEDSLIYTASLADGNDLPSWLSFNPENRTFNGTPVNEDVGNLSVRVTATDNDGESVSTSFELEVVNVNDTPILNTAIANQVATEDEAFSFTLAEDTFADVDAGDSLTYSATLADGSELPGWLSFDLETSTFSGTPVNENVGTLNVKLTATDNDGESVSDIFELEVVNVNDAPILENAIANQIAIEDEAFSFTFNETTFKDVDAGDVLTYTASLSNGSELPSWLSFDAETRTFSGIPVNENVSTLSVLVTATDNNGESVEDTFELEVINVNDTPTLENAIANQVATEDAEFSFTFPVDTFNDVDAGDSLTYSATNADGTELLSWLSFNADTRTFSGSPLNKDVGNLSIIVTATDNDGKIANDIFELEVINVNDAPTWKTAITNQTATEDIEFIFSFPEDTFNDVDAGDSLTYSATNADGSLLPSWLSFNAETRTFSGIPVNKDVGNLSIIVTATDQSGETISNAFELMVINVNDAPTLSSALANQTATEDESFNFTFPANTFNDVDAGDSLTYTVADANGNELPSWLTFDAETRTFSGTPVNEDVGNFSIQVTAADNDGETATDIFELEVINVNDTPLNINLSNLYIDENSSNGTIIGSLSTLDPDLGDSFSYTLLNNADGRFILNNNNLQVAAGNLLDFETNGSHQIEIQTTDTQGLSITKNFTLLLNDLNEAPITTNDRVTANSSNAKIISIESLLSNDRDPEGNPLSLVSIGNATGGKISLDGDSIVFTPNGTSNIGNFEYSVSDGVFTSTATVAIDVGGTQIGGKRSDTLNGTPGDDLIYGDSGNDTLNGGLGNDTLDGGKDNDLLLGGEGTDYLIGNSGLDTLDGGNGGDIYFADHNELDIYSDTGNYGVDVIKATGRKDFDLQLGLTFNQDNGIEQIDGTAISKKFEILDGGKNDNVWDFSDVELLDVDLIDGKKGNDLIIGSAGSDLIYGDSGNDTLRGGLGNDTLDGGKDDDYLSGGLGEDTLSGGQGKDSFIFNNPNEGIDTITDFSVKDDTLVFSAAGFGGNLTAGMVKGEMFTVGTAATSNEHRFIYNASSGDFFYDSDGTGDREQVKIAQLDSGLSLGNNDLFVDL